MIQTFPMMTNFLLHIQTIRSMQASQQFRVKQKKAAKSILQSVSTDFDVTMQQNVLVGIPIKRKNISKSNRYRPNAMCTKQNFAITTIVSLQRRLICARSRIPVKKQDALSAMSSGYTGPMNAQKEKKHRTSKFNHLQSSS